MFYQVMVSKYPTYTFPLLMPSVLLLAPYKEKREKKRAKYGRFYIPSSNDDLTLLLYVLRYPASVAYYSGYKVERLEMKNDIEAKRPQGMTWNDTKVMPFYAGEDLPDDRDILIISDKTGYAVKSGELPREWKEVGVQGRLTFFKRNHP